VLSVGRCARKIYKHFLIFLEYRRIFSLVLVLSGRYGGTGDTGGLHISMLKIMDALCRGFHLYMVLLNFAATLMSKYTNNIMCDFPFLKHFFTIGEIRLVHLLVLTDTVGALCFGIIHIGFLAIMKYMMRTFEMLVVGQLICVKNFTLADHQMTAADTDPQDGVRNYMRS
jgi:hypothetical protein